MFIRLLGQIGIALDDSLFSPLTDRVSAAVLAQLAMSDGRSVSVQSLIDAVWDHPNASARNAIQVSVTKLRKRLPDRRSIRTDSSGYSLNDPMIRVDWTETRELYRWSRELLEAENLAAALEKAERGLELYVGEPLAGLESFAATSFRSRAIEHRSGLLLLRARCLIELGRSREAIDSLRAEVERDPTAEEAPTLLMEALARSGHTPEALSVYHDLRHRLANELGIDPSPPSSTIFTQILTGSLPPGRTSRAIGTQQKRLPRPTGPLVGRETEVTAVVTLVHGGHRLVTIVGPGGIGKTRLAIAIAHRVADEMSRPAALIDLTLSRHPSDAVAEAAHVLDPDSVGLDLALRRTSMLVVLDNAEDVIGGVIKLVRIISAVDGVDILVTSRTPLHFFGEHIVDLGPLRTKGPDNPALALLVDSAGLSEGFATNQSSPLSDLVNASDGVPLVIDIFANALRWKSPQQLLNSIQTGSLNVLEATPGHPDRHATISAAIQWSISQADPESLRCLSALTVIRGYFNEQAATAIIRAAAPHAAPRPLLGKLLDLSLLQRVNQPGEVTFRMMEPFRDAVQHLSGVPEVSDSVVIAYAEHYLDRAGAAEDASVDSIEDLNDLRRIDQGNLGSSMARLWTIDADTAMRWLPSLLYYWYIHGPEDKLESWVTTALASQYGTPARRACVAIVRFLDLMWFRTERSEQLNQLTAFIAPYEDTLSEKWLFRWALAQASWARARGEITRALALIGDAEPTGRRDFVRKELSKSECLWYSGKLDQAKQIVAPFLEGRVNDDPQLRLGSLAIRGFIALEEQDLNGAQRAFDQHRSIAFRAMIRRELISAETNIAWVKLASGKHDDALRHVQEAIRTEYIHAQPVEVLEALTITGLASAEAQNMVDAHLAALWAARMDAIRPGTLNAYARVALSKLLEITGAQNDKAQITTRTAVQTLRTILDVDVRDMRSKRT